MNEINEHHITNSIRSYYRRKITAPAAYLVLLVILALIFPVRSMFFPTDINQKTNLKKQYSSRDTFVTAELKGLYFTGYRKYWLGRTRGYYYYTMMNDECVLVLLDPVTSEQGNPEIDSLRFEARLLKDPVSRDLLLDNLADDLSWTTKGLSASVSDYMISEPNATSISVRIFEIIYLLSAIVAVLNIIVCILYVRFPVISRPVRMLGAYGRPAKMLKEAETELSTLPQLATEDMFITQHYFIETSSYGVALVPIDRIVWIYKYSTLHKFLWHHFAITYTLYITADRHRYIRFPKNTKSNIDGIMDYLSEANHNILVGFTEENRCKVEASQGDSILFRKIRALISDRAGAKS